MKTCFNSYLCVALGLEPGEYEEGVGQSLKALRAWNGEGCVGVGRSERRDQKKLSFPVAWFPSHRCRRVYSVLSLLLLSVDMSVVYLSSWNLPCLSSGFLEMLGKYSHDSPKWLIEVYISRPWSLPQVSPKLLARANRSGRGNLPSKKRLLAGAQIALAHPVPAPAKYHEHHLG